MRSAVGLQLPANQVGRLPRASSLRPRHLGPVLERARVRPIDAVVGARELTLETAEAFETLAPYGRGNPQPRLLMPGSTAESAGVMGKGRHLNVPPSCGGAPAGGRVRPRTPARTLPDGARIDVQVRLGIERYQGLVGPRVTIDRLEVRIAGRDAIACAPACDLACPARDAGRGHTLRDPDPPTPGTRPTRAPRGVEDQRGEGIGLVRIAALARADAGVAVVVGDVARRRGMIDDVLHPERIGVEIAYRRRPVRE